MALEQPYARKESRGYLTPNRRKEKNSQPDHTGAVNIAGKQYLLSGWRGKTKGGEQILNLTVKER
jgi:hypothetical protein